MDKKNGLSFSFVVSLQSLLIKRVIYFQKHASLNSNLWRDEGEGVRQCLKMINSNFENDRAPVKSLENRRREKRNFSNKIFIRNKLYGVFAFCSDASLHESFTILANVEKRDKYKLYCVPISPYNFFDFLFLFCFRERETVLSNVRLRRRRVNRP